MPIYMKRKTFCECTKAYQIATFRRIKLFFVSLFSVKVVFFLFYVIATGWV